MTSSGRSIWSGRGTRRRRPTRGGARTTRARALYNCLPSEPIGDRLAEFGGGVLMSATLEPMDVFREVTGLDHLEQRGRPVVERTACRSRPKTVRVSLSTRRSSLTRTAGHPARENDTRLAHLDATVAVASRGERARRNAELRGGDVDGRVALETTGQARAARRVVGRPRHGVAERRLLRGRRKVLVTSLRGTLTEGVDYRGDRLSAAVVWWLWRPDHQHGAAADAGGDHRLRQAVRVGIRNRPHCSGGPEGPAGRRPGSFVGRTNTEFASCSTPGTRVSRGTASGSTSRTHEREEYQPVSPDMLGLALDRFERQVGNE